MTGKQTEPRVQRHYDVVEGNHRINALYKLGVKSFPAMVVRAYTNDQTLTSRNKILDTPKAEWYCYLVLTVFIATAHKATQAGCESSYLAVGISSFIGMSPSTTNRQEKS